MEKQELEKFIKRIGNSSEVNIAYFQLNWQEFLINKYKNIRHTPYRDDSSVNSLSFNNKDSIATSFELSSSDKKLFSKHIRSADSRICTLHSSALLPLLLFYSVNQTPIEIDGIEYDEVYFEVPNKVFDKSRPSKIDVALVSKSSETILYLESKFTEYLSGKSSNSFSKNYELFVKKVLKEQPVEKDGKLYIRGKVGNKEIIYGEGIKQIIAHFIGVCKGGTDKNSVKKYITNNYTVLLGCIVYKWNNRFDDYNGLYEIVAKSLNSLLRKNERTGKGSDVKQNNVNSILLGAPQKFSVIEKLLTYQELIEKNKNKFNPHVLEFYKLNV